MRNHHAKRRGVSACIRAVAVLATGSALAVAVADPPTRGEKARSDETGYGAIGIPVRTDGVATLRVEMDPIDPSSLGGAVQSQGGCPPQVSTHTDADFTGGSFIAQAGFEQGEIAATSFQLTPDDFPLQIDLMEMIFATASAVVQTTTHWSILVWEGTPNNGNLVAEYSSDGAILPHIVLPPGTNGVNVQVLVDPDDPDQIILQDNGTSTFSVGYRIDQHNSPGNPCLTAPPSNMNAFPTTDVSGLASPSGNWIFAIDGTLCLCGNGWFTFQGFPSFCTPSGDWVMRVTWHPFFCDIPTGECCMFDGSCEEMSEADCQAAGGTYGGDGTVCDGSCPPPNEDVACCFVGGGCLDLPQGDCILAGGFPSGPGTVCATTECFPMGACCLPDGSCADDMDPDACAALGGSFQGNNSTCAGTTCPDPQGACCFDTGFCLVLTEADCAQAGATWMGFDTDCDDDDGNGTADACEAGEPCVGDLDGDNEVATSDLLALLANWGGNGAGADLAEPNDVVETGDLLVLLANWGTCP